MITENLPTPPEPRLTSSRAEHDVLAERERQVTQEGWTAEHDDDHQLGDMAQAGACYAAKAAVGHLHAHWFPTDNGIPCMWPWSDEWWKPKDRRRNLVRAAALIIAEIERIDRASSEDSANG